MVQNYYKIVEKKWLKKIVEIKWLTIAQNCCDNGSKLLQNC